MYNYIQFLVSEVNGLKREKRGQSSIDRIGSGPLHCYLTEIPRYFHIMPIIVIKFSIDWLHKSFKGPGPQINDQRNRPVFQRQVDVVGRFARVQHESVPLQGSERERDLVAAALNRVLRQVVAEVFGTLKGRHVFLPSCRRRRENKKRGEATGRASGQEIQTTGPAAHIQCGSEDVLKCCWFSVRTL